MKTLTSKDSPLFLARVVDEGASGGWVALTIAPGKKTVGTFNRWDRDLDLDLDRLDELGATSLVCLLTEPEISAFSLGEYAGKARASGFAFLGYPIRDVDIPENTASFGELIDDLAHRFLARERIVIHCNGGLGRAGTVGACLRLRMGLDADAVAAIESIRARRSRRAIETSSQEAFIARYFGSLVGPGGSDIKEG